MGQLSVTFPDLVCIRRCSYTVSHGFRPGVAVVECVPQTITTVRGSLVFSDGVTSVTLTNALCTETGRRNRGDATIQVLQIQDRRWRWQFPIAIGQYNVRKPDGTVDSATAKTARQLATMLFAEMDAGSVDVSALPNDDYPFVDWQGEKAWVACQRLLARYGCDVAPNFATDAFDVVSLGSGSSLPSGGTEMTVSLGASFDPWPDNIRLACGRTVWETKFKLQAVGVDTDGSIQPIDDLTYAPEETWEEHGGVFVGGNSNWSDLIPEASELEYGLANQTVYRWYQIAEVVDGVPEDGGEEAAGNWYLPGDWWIPSIQHALPLRQKRLVTYTTTGEQYEAPPLVEGTYLQNQEPLPLENTNDFTQVDRRFRIDGARGLVMFSVPIVRFNEDGDKLLPAELYLTTSHYAQGETKNFLFYYREQIIASNGVPTESRLREEHRATIKGVYTDDTLTSVVNNATSLNAILDLELAAWAAGYTVQSATVVKYANVLAIALTGKIRAVQWVVDCGDPGDGGAYTVGAENTEALLGLTPRWARYRAAKSEPDDSSSARRRKGLRKK